jgi:hypothetical protein
MGLKVLVKALKLILFAAICMKKVLKLLERVNLVELQLERKFVPFFSM